ncbi:hypothetical protein P3T76_000959 [Phytophthora citrophthora]|uniref:Uncharacterized protein n=1 Tax=Phytophthora citrophthora TaxID=4793 RepID=A0AAD9GXL6_9STRA|nr:hypothetical protein P3T76_000959 [Phytophthora citrophthora]
MKTMPLFDAIESDVTAFFVAQGTVFDSLVKAIMDRVAGIEFNLTGVESNLAGVESRLALMRTEVRNDFHLVNQRIDASNAAAGEVSAATAAAAAAAAASAALASLPLIEYTSNPAAVATMVKASGERNEELEYFIMTLSRQLNMVLEVLFQPHGSNNVVEVVQAKQTQMQSISDVLTENEAILMQLAAQHEDWRMPHVENHVSLDSIPEQNESDGVLKSQSLDDQQLPQEKQQHATSDGATVLSGLDASDSSQEKTKPATAVDTIPRQIEPPKPNQSSESHPDIRPKSSISPPEVNEQQPPVEPQSKKHEQSLRQVVETVSPQLQASPLTKKEEIVREVSSNQTHKPDEQELDDDDERRDQMSVDSSLFRPQPRSEGPLHRTKSFFRNCQDLQRQEADRLREQRRREEELMRRMHELLLQSRSHLQQEHIDEWRQQQHEVTQNQQTLIYHLQDQLREQLQLQQQRDQDWRRQLEEQRAIGVTSIQHEVDRKLETLDSLVAAIQATQSHELTQVKQLVDDFEKRFISPDALQEAGALWLKTAADNCIYGANPDSLASLQRDLQSFKSLLNAHPVKSPAISSLHEAADRALQLLQQSLDGTLKGSEQENAMYTLRQLLAKLDASYQAAATEYEEFPLPVAAFLSETIHRMELGTANLLDAVDFQQEHIQQTLTQQQAGLEKLQKELWRQQEVELALRNQLGACPSKEDTMRLVQDLRDQITTTTADSASRMLDTVDDLRYRMAGLPNSQMLEQLASDLHAKTDRITHDLDAAAGKLSHDLRQKADRAEIDRLQSLLESSNGNGTNAPPAYLTKSPLKCLSCDQHLPFGQAPHEDSMRPEQGSNPGSPTSQRPGSPPRSPPSSPSRPILYFNQHQQLAYPYQQNPGFTQSPDNYTDLGINVGILEELFAASTSALERRRQQRQRLQMQLLGPQADDDSHWFSRKSTFLNIDDGRNRIPLRKVPLSDQVIYGPAITPHAFRKKQLGRPDEYVGLLSEYIGGICKLTIS